MTFTDMKNKNKAAEKEQSDVFWYLKCNKN